MTEKNDAQIRLKSGITKLSMVRFNGMDYFYAYNVQSDVVLMIDTNSTQSAEYVYDAWELVSKTGTVFAEDDDK